MSWKRLQVCWTIISDRYFFLSVPLIRSFSILHVLAHLKVVHTQKAGKLYPPPKWIQFCQKAVCSAQWLMFPYNLLIKNRCKNSEGKFVQYNEVTQNCLSARQSLCTRPVSARKNSWTRGPQDRIHHFISVLLELRIVHAEIKPFHYHSPFPLIPSSVTKFAIKGIFAS